MYKYKQLMDVKPNGFTVILQQIAANCTDVQYDMAHRPYSMHYKQRILHYADDQIRNFQK